MQTMEDTKITQQPEQEDFSSFAAASEAAAQTPSPERRPRKKKKSKRVRLLQRRLIVLAVALGIFFLIFSMGSAWRGSRGAKISTETVTAQLKSLTDLSSTSYHFTNVERFENIDDFYGWDASDYSSFTLSYSGAVTAEVDVSKAKVEVKGKSITVTLPEAAISGQEIAQDSVSVLKEGKFEAIELSDFAGFKDNQKQVVEAKATADGLLFDASDKAKAAAKALIETMTGGSDKYEISIK